MCILYSSDNSLKVIVMNKIAKTKINHTLTINDKFYKVTHKSIDIDFDKISIYPIR